MIYHNDWKKLTFDTIDDSITIIRNEQRFFAWLAKTLKPEYAKYLEHSEEGYNADSDEERSWFSYGETEHEYIEDLMKHHAECGSSHFELSQFDTKSRLPETYDFGIDYHYAKKECDLPKDFEKENNAHWAEFHYWKDGRVIEEPEDEDEPGNLIEVFTL